MEDAQPSALIIELQVIVCYIPYIHICCVLLHLLGINLFAM